jgi:hypothetical protein
MYRAGPVPPGTGRTGPVPTGFANPGVFTARRGENGWPHCARERNGNDGSYEDH